MGVIYEAEEVESKSLRHNYKIYVNSEHSCCNNQ